MELVFKVLWTDTAIKQLKDIFYYYKEVADYNTANKLIKSIINRTDILSTLPRMFKREELLRDRDLEYRFLVEKNYKIIYWIKDNYVNIASVFDCRQHPLKITKI